MTPEETARATGAAFAAVVSAHATHREDWPAPPRTDAALVLSILRAWDGCWVPNLYKVTGVMVHSRIADLRRQGHVIESKCFSKASGVKGDYRYRLVAPTQGDR